MPAYKNQIARFKVINECLCSRYKKYWSKQELIDKILEKTDIAISERSLDHDISCLRNNDQLKFFAPIKHSKRENGYHYTDPTYSIDKLPLNEKDIEVLEFATTTLMQYRNVGILNEFAGTVDKLINLVNHIKNTNHETHFSFIDFEKAPYSKGTEYLDILVEAIKNKKVIELTYLKFEEEQAKVHIMSPYLLKEYRNRWYILGLLHKRKSIITFGLDRISEIKILSNESFHESKEFKTESYFKNTIGISFSEEEPEEIVLSFTPLQGKYIKTQHLHITQETIIDDDKEFRIKLNLVINYELISTILSYGKDVKIVSPDILKKQVGEIIIESYKNYNQI